MKSPRHFFIRKPLKSLLPIFVLALFSSSAHALVCKSTNTTGNWSTNATWTGCSSATPGPTDTVEISTGCSISLDISTTIGSLRFYTSGAGTSASLTHSGANVVLTINGAVTMNAPGNTNTSITWDINSTTATVTGGITYITAANTRVRNISITSGQLNANGGIFPSGTVVGNQVLTVSGAGTVNLKGLLSMPSNSITLSLAAPSTFTYADTTSSQVINMPPAGQYGNLYIANGSTSSTLAGAITQANLSGNIRVQSGTFSNGNQAITGNAAATFQVDSGAFFRMVGTAQFPTSFGTYSFDPASKVEYLQASGPITISSRTYGNLDIKPATTSRVNLGTGTISVAGDMTIGDGVVLASCTANSGNPSTLLVTGTVTINALSAFMPSTTTVTGIAGGLVNLSTMSAYLSTIAFTGTAAEYVQNKGQTISYVISSNTSSGGLIFSSSLTATQFLVDTTALGAAATVYFAGNSTYTIANFLPTGSSSNHVVLKSTDSTKPWYLNATTRGVARWAEVQRSSASAGQTIGATFSTDLGNNLNWAFSPTWTGAISNSWGNANNWSNTQVPSSTDDVAIPLQGTQPSLDANRSVKSLTLIGKSTLALNNFNLTVTNDIVNVGTITASGSEQITVGGNWDGTGGWFNAAQSTVNFASTNGQTVQNVFQFGTVVSSNTSAAGLTFSSSFTARRLYVDSALNSAATIYFAGKSSFTISTLTITGSSANPITLKSTDSAQSWVLKNTAVNNVSYVAVQRSDASLGNSISPIASTDLGNNTNWLFATQWTGASSTNWGLATNWSNNQVPSSTDDIVIPLTGTQPLLDQNRFVNSLTISQGGAVLDLNNFNLSVSSYVTLVGTLTARGAEQISFGGNWDMSSGWFNAAQSTVTFASGSTITVASNGKRFANFNSTGSGTVLLADGMKLSALFTLSTGTFDTGTSNNYLDVSSVNFVGGTFNGNTSSVTISGGWTMVNNATYFSSYKSTFTFTGAGAKSFNTGPVAGNMNFAGVGSTWTATGGSFGGTMYAPGGLQYGGVITVSAGYLNFTNFNQLFCDQFIIAGGTVTLNQKLVVQRDWQFISGGFSSGGFPVEFNPAFRNKVSAGGMTFGDVQIAFPFFSFSTLVLGETLNVGGSLTISSNSLDTTSNNYSVNVTSNFVISGGSFTANGSNIVVGGDWDTQSGSFGAGTSTVTLKSSYSQAVRLSTSPSFNGRTFANFVSSNTNSAGITFYSSFTAARFSIDAGALGSASKVNFNAASTVTVSTFVVNGTASQYVTLTGTSTWFLKNTSTNTVSYVNASFSNASSSSTIFAGGYSNDQGGNTNWDFGQTGKTTVRWTGASSNSWGTSGNWNPARIPGNYDDVVIPNVGTQPQLDQARNTGTVTLNHPNSSLAMNGYNLTVASNVSNAGTITASNSEQLVLKGNWYSSGTVAGSNGWIVFASTNAQYVDNTGLSFANLQSSNTSTNGLIFSSSFTAAQLKVDSALAAATTIYFTSGATVTISSFNIAGSGSGLVALKPTSSGQWYLNNTSTNNVSSVAVASSNANPGISVSAKVNTTDLGNNLNWNFGQSVWTGISDTNFGNPSNWSPVGVPGAADNAVIPLTTNKPVLDQARTIASLNISQGGASLDLNNFNLSVSSYVTLVGTLTARGSEQISVGGPWTVQGGWINPANSTITFVGTGTNTFTLQGVPICHLNINAPNGVLSLGSGLNLQGTFTETTGSFTTTSSNYYLSVASNVSLMSGLVTFNGSTITASRDWTVSASSFALPHNSTVTFNGTGARNIYGTGSTILVPANMVFNMSGTTWTINIPTNNVATFGSETDDYCTLLAGTVIPPTNSLLTAWKAKVIINGGTLSSTWKNNFYNDFRFFSGDMFLKYVWWAAPGAVRSGGKTWQNFGTTNILSHGSVKLEDDLTVLETLQIANGRLDSQGYAITASSNVDFASGVDSILTLNNSTFTIGGDFAMQSIGSINWGNSLVLFASTSTQNVNLYSGAAAFSSSQEMSNVVSSNTSAGGLIFTSSFTAKTFTIDAAHLSAPASVTFLRGSTVTISTLVVTGSANRYATLTSTGVWMLKNTSTNTVSYANVSFSSASLGKIIMAGGYSIDSGGNTNWDFGASDASAVTWNGTSSNDWGTATNWTPNRVPQNFDSVTIPNVATQPRLDVARRMGSLLMNHPNSTLTLNGYDLFVASQVTNAGTFTASGNERVTVGGNWYSSGTASGGNSWVIFTSTNTQYVDNAGKSFANVLSSNTAAGGLIFSSSFSAAQFQISSALNAAATAYLAGKATFTISTFNVNGTSAFPVTLKSTSTDSWYLNNTSQNSISYVQVSSCDASAGRVIAAGNTSTDLGNNVNWDFGRVSWTGAVDTNFGNANNWTPSVVPTSTYSVVIPLTARNPVLDHSRNISSLNISQGGASLDLNGSNLGVGGNVVLVGTLTARGGEQINFSGNWTMNGGWFNAAQSTVQYTGNTVSTLITQGGHLKNLLINGQTGTLALGDGLNLDGQFTMATGSFTTTGSNYYLSVASNVYLAGGGVTFNASTITASGNWIVQSSTFYAPYSSTVTFNGVGQLYLKSLTLNSSRPTVPANIIFNMTGSTWLITSDVNPQTELSNEADDSLTLVAGTVWITSGAVTGERLRGKTVFKGGTLVENETIFPYNDWDFQSGDYVLVGNALYGNALWSAQNGISIRSGGKMLPSISLQNTGTSVLRDDLKARSLGINSNCVFDSASFAITVDSHVTTNGGTFKFNGSTVTLGGNLDNFGVTSSVINYGTSTFVFAGASTQTISLVSSAKSFYNLVSSNTSSGGLQFLSSCAIQQLTIDASALAGPANVSFASGSTVTISTFLITGTSSKYVNLNSTGTWYLKNTSTNTVNYANVIFSNATSSNTIFAGGYSNDLGGNSNWDFGIGGAVTWTGSSDTNWGNANNWSPARIPQALDDVTIPGVATQPILDTSRSVRSLTLTHPSASLSLNNFNLYVASQISNAGTITTVGTEQIRVGGNWYSSGTFSGTTSWIIFPSTNPQYIDDNGTRLPNVLSSNTTSGGLVFLSSFSAAQLKVDGATLKSATTLYFASGSTFTISTFSTVGLSSYPVVLLPTGSNQWCLNNTSSNSVAWVRVSSSNARGGITILAGLNSVDLGGNENWDFGNVMWVGAIDSNFGNSYNWSPNIVPTSTHNVIIPLTGQQPVLDQTRTIYSLYVSSGGAYLDLNNFNLTVSSFVTLVGTLTARGTERISIGGNFDLSSGCFNGAQSTVTMNTNITSSITINANGRHLSGLAVSGIGYLTLASGLDVDQVFSMNAGGFDTNVSSFYVSVGSTMYLNSGNLFFRGSTVTVLGSAFNSATWGNSATLNRATFTFSGAGTKRLGGFFTANCIFDGVGSTWSVSANNSQIGVSSNGSVALLNGLLKATGFGSFKLGSDGEVVINGGSLDITGTALTLGGNWTFLSGNILNTDSTVSTNRFNGSGTKIISGGVPFYNLTVSAPLTLGDDLVVSSLFTMVNTFDTSSGNFSVRTDRISHQGRMILNSSTMTLSGNWTASGVTSTMTPGNSTIVFNSTSAQVMSFLGMNFANVVSSNINSQGLTFTSTSNFSLAKLLVDSSGLSVAPKISFPVSSTITISTLSISGTPAKYVTLTSTNGTSRWFLKNTSSASVSYAKVSLSSASLGQTVTATYSIDQGGNTNWDFGSGSAIVWTGATNNDWGTAGNWSPARVPLTGDDALIPNVGTQPQLDTARSIRSLTLDHPNSSLALNGFDLYVASQVSNAGTITASAAETIRVGGNWYSSGTVSGSSMWIVFPSTNGQFVDNQGKSFANVLSSNTSSAGILFVSSFTAAQLKVDGPSLGAAATMYFTSGATFTVSTFSVNGSTNAFITLKPTANQPWYLNNTSSQSVTYVQVSYSSASLGALIRAGRSSTDLGNNTNWAFGSRTWTGGTSTNFGTDSNWSPAAAPVSGDDVTIAPSSNDPLLDQSRIINSLVIQSGAKLDVNNFNLTVTTYVTVGGTLTARGTELISFGGNWDMSSGRFDAAQSTVCFTSFSTVTINTGGRHFFNFWQFGKGTVVLGSGLDVDHMLNIATGTFDTNINNGYYVAVGTFMMTGSNFVLRSSTMSIYGSWFAISNTSTFNQSHYYFVGTGSKTITGNIQQGDIDFNGPGSTWTLQGSGTPIWGEPNSSRTISFLGGTVDLNGVSLTLGSDTGLTVINGGVLNLNSSAVTVKSTFTFLSGDLIPGTAVVTFTGSNLGTRQLTTGGKSFYALTNSQSPSGSVLQLQDNLNVLNNLNLSGSGGFDTNNFNVNIASGFSMTSGTVTLNSSLVTLGGSFSATGGKFVAGSSTVCFSSSTGQLANMGSFVLANIVSSNTSSSGLSIISSFTAAQFTVNAAALNSGATIWNFSSSTATISTFSVTGSSGKQVVFRSAGPWYLRNTSTNTVSYTTAFNSDASSGVTIMAGTNSVDQGGNVNWSFGSLERGIRYWVPYGGTTWSDPNAWAYDSGGTGGAGVPLSTHAVVIDGAVGRNGDCTLDTDVTVASLVVRNSTGAFNTNGYNFTDTGDLTVINSNLAFSTSHVMLAGNVYLSTGSLDANRSTVTFIGTQTQQMFTKGQAFWSIVSSNTSTGGLQFSSSFSATNFIVDATGLNSGATVYFAGGSTYTITNFIVNGRSGNYIVLNSTASGKLWNLNNLTTGTNSVSYVSVGYSSATQGKSIVAGVTSVDQGNNFNWNFGAAGSTITWTGAVNDVWTNTGNWDLGRFPSSADDVVIASVTNKPRLDRSVATANLTINTGAELKLSGYDITIGSSIYINGIYPVGGKLTASANEQINVAGNWNSNGGQFDGAYSSVTISGSSWDPGFASSFGNITFSGNGTYGFNTYARGNVNITKGTLQFLSGRIGGDITFSGTSSQNWNAAGLVYFDGSFFGNGTGSGSTEQAVFTSSDAATLSGSMLCKATIAGAGPFTLKAFSNTVQTTISSGPVDAQGVSTFFGRFDMEGGTLTVHSPISVTEFIQNAGSFQPLGSTVTLANVTDSGKIITTNAVFDHLLIKGSGSSYHAELGSALNVTGNLTTDSESFDTKGYDINVGSDLLVMGGSFSAQNSRITIGKNVYMSAVSSSVFLPGTSSLVFGSSLNAQNMYAPSKSFSTIIASNTVPAGLSFSSSFTATQFVANTSGLAQGTTIYFAGGSTFTIGSLSLAGSVGKYVVLRSTSEPNAWYLNNTISQDVSAVDVKYSNASLGNTIFATGNSVDNGNNSNWTFVNPQTLVWTGTTNRNWGTATNWDLGRVPYGVDNIVIPATSNQPQLDQNRQVRSLTISQGGARLELNGYDLIVSSYVVNAGTVAASAAEKIVTRGNMLSSGTVSGSALSLVFESNNTQYVDLKGSSVGVVKSSNTSSGGLIFTSSFTAQQLVATPSGLGSSCTIYFAGASTFTISTITIAGNSNFHAVLKSTSSSVWYLKNTGINAVSFAEIQLSSASLGHSVLPSTSTDLGSNTNWIFNPTTLVWTGALDNNFGNAGNWDLFSLPRASDTVLIANVGAQPSVLDQARTIGDLTISTGAHLDLNNFNLTMTGDVVLQGTMTARSTEFIDVSGDWTCDGGRFNAAVSTVNFRSVLAHSYYNELASQNQPFYNLASWDQTGNGAFVTRDTTTINGSFYSDTYFIFYGSSMTIFGNVTLGTDGTDFGSGRVSIAGNFFGSWLYGDATLVFTATESKVVNGFYASGPGSDQAEFNGRGGSWLFSGNSNTYMHGLSVVQGTVTLNMPDGYTDSVAMRGGTLQMGNSRLTVYDDWFYESGNFDAATSTIEFYSGSYPIQVNPGGYAFNNLVFSNSATKLLMGDLRVHNLLTVWLGSRLDTNGSANYSVTVDSDVNISGGTFTANASIITVGGSWSDTGRFESGTSDVRFSSTTAGQRVSSVDPFYKLTSRNSSAGGLTFRSSFTVQQLYENTADLGSSATLYFAPGSTWVISNLSLNGTASYPIVLKSTNTSTWGLNNTNTNSVTFVDVKNSNASLGATINAGAGSRDSGGNTNWTFAAPTTITWTGTTDADWSKTTNWDLARLPLSNDDVVVPNTTNKPQLDQNRSVRSLNISEGAARLELNGFNLQVSSYVTIVGTLTASGGERITVGGNWSNSGVFIASSSQVQFESNQAQYVDNRGGRFATLISSNIGANGLIFSSSFTADLFSINTQVLASAATVYFAGLSTFTVSTFSVNGSLNFPVVLRSTNSGTAWYLNDRSSNTVFYVDVKDSNATQGRKIVDQLGGVNSGGNTNWRFGGSTITWTGTTDTVWSRSSNWDVGDIPYSVDDVVIPNTSNKPTLDSVQTLRSLTINSSGRLNLNGYNISLSTGLFLAGRLTASSGEQICLGGDWNSTGGQFDAAQSTINFISASYYNRLTSGGMHLGNVHFGNGLWTLQDGLWVDGVFRISGGQFETNSLQNNWVYISSDVYLADPDTLHDGWFGLNSSTITILGNYSTNNWSSSHFSESQATMTFSGANQAKALDGYITADLRFNGAGSTWTMTQSNSIQLLTIDAGVFFSTKGFQASQAIINGGVLWTPAGNFSVSKGFRNQSGDFQAGSSTWTIQYGHLRTNGRPFSTLIAGSNSVGIVLDDALTVSGNFLLTAGVFDSSATGNFPITFQGDVTSQGAIVTPTFAFNRSTISVGGNWNTDLFLNVRASQSTIIFNSANAQSVKFTGASVGNIISSNTSSGGLSFISSFTAQSLTLSAATLGSSATIYFPVKATSTISTFTVVGSAANHAVLLSTSASESWYLNNTSQSSVSYTEVKRSSASLGLQLTDLAGVDLGNNDNWVFTSPPSAITTTGSGNWFSTVADAPWPSGTVPQPSDTVIVANTHVVTATCPVTVASLTVNSGGTLNLDGANRTVTFTVGNGGKFINNGSVVVVSSQNAVTLNGPTGGDFTFEGTDINYNAKKIYVGRMIYSPTATIGNGSTVELSASTTYYAVTTQAGAKLIQGTNNDLTLKGNSTLATGTFTKDAGSGSLLLMNNTTVNSNRQNLGRVRTGSH